MQRLLDDHGWRPQRVRVPGTAPGTRQQWKEWSDAHWPLTWRAPVCSNLLPAALPGMALVCWVLSMLRVLRCCTLCYAAEGPVCVAIHSGRVHGIAPRETGSKHRAIPESQGTVPGGMVGGASPLMSAVEVAAMAAGMDAAFAAAAAAGANNGAAILTPRDGKARLFTAFFLVVLAVALESDPGLEVSATRL